MAKTPAYIHGREIDEDEIGWLKSSEGLQGTFMCQADDCTQTTRFRYPTIKGIAYCSWGCWLRHKEK